MASRVICRDSRGGEHLDRCTNLAARVGDSLVRNTNMTVATVECQWARSITPNSGPTRISRHMRHVGMRAKKTVFELADCLHTRTKMKHFHTGAGASFYFLGTVCDKFELFVYAAKFCSFRSFWNSEF